MRNGVIFSANGYKVATEYDVHGNFLSANGGKWSLEEDFRTEVLEFHSNDPSWVGQCVRLKASLTVNSLPIADGRPVWTRIDSGAAGSLAGTWLISGRKQNDVLTQRDTSRLLRTMKILSGTGFQRVATILKLKNFLAQAEAGMKPSMAHTPKTESSFPEMLPV